VFSVTDFTSSGIDICGWHERDERLAECDLHDFLEGNAVFKIPSIVEALAQSPVPPGRDRGDRGEEEEKLRGGYTTT
jgi:hypothetical protein